MGGQEGFNFPPQSGLTVALLRHKPVSLDAWRKLDCPGKHTPCFGGKVVHASPCWPQHSRIRAGAERKPLDFL